MRACVCACFGGGGWWRQHYCVSCKIIVSKMAMQNEKLLVLEERIMVIDERWIRVQRTTYTVENNQSSTLLISIGLQYFIIYFIRFHLISSWGRSVVANREPVAKEDCLVVLMVLFILPVFLLRRRNIKMSVLQFAGPVYQINLRFVVILQKLNT